MDDPVFTWQVVPLPRMFHPEVVSSQACIAPPNINTMLASREGSWVDEAVLCCMQVGVGV